MSRYRAGFTERGESRRPTLTRPRRLPKREEITVKGLHFIQEDSPAEIGKAVTGFIRQNAER